MVLIYWRLRSRQQNLFLLAASYTFYGWWDWRFLLLMMGSTVIDYHVARKIDTTDGAGKRRTLLVLSLVINFTILGFFKYFNFFLDSAARSLDMMGLHNIPHGLLAIVLPPGISFYTFQEVAYIVDVYKGRGQASSNLIDYALFISLFPHLIAGPIQRPSHLLPQVQNPRIFNAKAFHDGCMLILMGLVRKTVIADNCAHLADAAFDGRLGANAAATLIGVYAFAWQIYGDFSGYSDLARGSAQLLGFHFMVNFRQPYLAESLQDFWRRWHISLSTWLRDYLYIPLGGNRGTNRKTYRNVMTTMLLGGLWHGANWTFVVWGAIQGLGLSLERFAFGRRKRHDDTAGSSRWMRRVITFHLVCIAWIFFRAKTFSEALTMVRNLGRFHWSPDYAAGLLLLGILAALALLIDLVLESDDSEYLFQRQSPVLQQGVAVIAVVLLILCSASGGHAFIYFQF